MLIFEIATGIILAVLLLAFWRVALAFGGIVLGLGALLIVALLASTVSWNELWQSLAAIVVLGALFSLFVVHSAKAEFARQLAEEQSAQEPGESVDCVAEPLSTDINLYGVNSDLRPLQRR